MPLWVAQINYKEEHFLGLQHISLLQALQKVGSPSSIGLRPTTFNVNMNIIPTPAFFIHSSKTRTSFQPVHIVHILKSGSTIDRAN